MSKTGRPRGAVPESVRLQRERFIHEEYMAELELQKHRETLISGLLKDPRIYYTLAIGGSGVVAWLGAILTAGKDPKTGDERDAVDKANKILAGGLIAASFGPVGLAFDAAFLNPSVDNGGPIGALLKAAGAGGGAFFAVCLILHEMFGGNVKPTDLASMIPGIGVV